MARARERQHACTSACLCAATVCFVSVQQTRAKHQYKRNNYNKISHAGIKQCSVHASLPQANFFVSVHQGETILA